MNSWVRANHNLIAKAIGELHFEEVLAPVRAGEGWTLTTQTGVQYRFTADLGAWNHVWPAPLSLKRSADGETSATLSAAQFFIDVLPETGMGELTLGTFLEEMHNTLVSDAKMLERTPLSSCELSLLPDVVLQQNLPGHPKLLLNKGRMGWGATDHALYAPESAHGFQLHWILARRASLIGSGRSDWDFVIAESFTEGEASRLRRQLTDLTASEQDFMLLPVHPWQWDHVITQQFAGELANGNIISLGEMGDRYLPQTSLRTLANLDRPTRMDIKLPLSILNTSCVRGLPQRYLDVTPALSDVMEKICATDPELSQLAILVEKSAWGYQHPHFKQVPGAAYRYHEYLGAVWRESTDSKLAAHEQTVLSGALIERDSQGDSLISAYANRARVSEAEWVRHYARQVIVPLYHLQLAHGIGVVAHGQNVVVRLRYGLPVGVIIKDFHGDLRLATTHAEKHQQLLGEICTRLTRLPPEHLIHDLITGHFITVLRFISRTLAACDELPESLFYSEIAQELRVYQEQHATLLTPATDLLAQDFLRILINRVRFQVGYGDSHQRPLPLLGATLKNPLYRGTTYVTSV